MSNSDASVGSTGGPVPLSDLNDLPEKLRVHALAKLLGRTSRDVLAVLSELGVTARSPQSSVDRKTAEQVASALVPELGAPAGDTGPAREVLEVADEAGPDAVAPVDRPTAAVVPAFGTPAAAAEVVRPAEPVAPLAPLFAPPAPVFAPPAPPAPPARRTRRRGAAEPDQPAAEEPPTIATGPTALDRDADAPVDDAPAEQADGDLDDLDDRADDDSADSSARRRRRRGRRGRGRGRGGEGDGPENADDAETADGEAGADTDDEDDEPTTDTTTDPASDTAGGESDDESDEPGDDDAESDAGSRRRRRRRRRRGTSDEAAVEEDTDPPNTVVRVRAPRERSDDTDGDGVQSVRGSTRLEAKRQRRRDGRDAGRRRVPILSEAEFLARRESVERSMVVRERGDRVEIGVLEDGVLVEHFVTGGENQNDSLVGNIYLGRVQNVLPSMEAAFVDIGRGRNAVLYAGEVDWDAAGLGGRARRIEQALSSGDSVLVQVTKDPVGHKGARLTTQISLAGRFLVYVPSGGAAGISRKLPDIERKRLKDMLREIVPSEAGVIIRTASEGVTQEALERDVRRLQAQWEVVKERSEKTGPSKPKAPVLLYEEPDMLVKVVRDQFNEDFSRLVVSGDDAWETVSNYIGHVAPELAGRLHRHVGSRDVFAEYRIDEQLLKALDRKVWLPSGGTLVIDRTEAMTVVDVNTGKYTGSGGNLEETVTRNNLEAAEEIVRQLRLRDIGGIIVVDFIDMVLEANRDLVVRRLTECLARDRTRHQVAEVTSLGLVQMTRKRVGGGLLEHFSTPCEHCRGRGVIVSTEQVTEQTGRGGDRNGDRKGDRNGDRNGDRTADRDRAGDAGDAGGRRSRGRGKRDEPGTARRLPDAITPVVTPDRGDATLDVGAPAPEPEDFAASEPGTVEPVTVESVRDDVEEVVVEQALAQERNRHAAGNGRARTGTADDRSAELGDADLATTPGDADLGSTDLGSAAIVPDATAAPVNGVAVEEAAPPRAPRRRGRVTRTAGAPTTTTGEAPAVTVVTVPGPAVRDAAVADASVPDVAVPDVAVPDVAVPDVPEADVAVPDAAVSDAAVSDAAVSGAAVPDAVVAPEPTRPRRARRAASRPAGPPAAESGGDPV